VSIGLKDQNREYIQISMVTVSLFEVTLVERISITHSSNNLKLIRDFTSPQPNPAASTYFAYNIKLKKPSRCGKYVDFPEQSE
jgi:hypothetical protein